MKHKALQTPFSVAALLIGILALPPVSAKEHRKHADDRMISQINLPTSAATDLFLRTNSAGRVFLYVAYSNHAISTLDVTNSREPKMADELFPVPNPPKVYLRPLSTDTVTATAAPDPSQQWTVVDENAAGVPQIAKQFAHVDAYMIDGDRNLVYVVEKGKLSIFQFDRPLTKDAEIWEQGYEAR